MSAHGHFARKPSDGSAPLVLGSVSLDHQATHAEPTNLAYHVKESSQVVEDHHTNKSVPETKTIHEGQDGKPTITLTAYDKEHSPELSVLNTITTISEGYADEEFIKRPDDQLQSQLEDYFLALKSEFKAKTGREWEPLRAWPAEEWDWEWDDEEA